MMVHTTLPVANLQPRIIPRQHGHILIRIMGHPTLMPHRSYQGATHTPVSQIIHATYPSLSVDLY